MPYATLVPDPVTVCPGVTGQLAPPATEGKCKGLLSSCAHGLPESVDPGVEVASTLMVGVGVGDLIAVLPLHPISSSIVTKTRPCQCQRCTRDDSGNFVLLLMSHLLCMMMLSSAPEKWSEHARTCSRKQGYRYTTIRKIRSCHRDC